MALGPAYFQTKLNSNINEVFTGTISNVFVAPDGQLIPTTPSLVPSHGLSGNGSRYTANEQAVAFTGGDADDPATCTIRCKGSYFALGTINEIAFLMQVRSRTARVAFQFDCAVGTTTSDAVLTGLAACLTAGYTAATPAAGSRIICSDPEATPADIQAAMVYHFGASATFVLASNTVVITLGDDGAAGNYFQAWLQVHNSPPSPVLSMTPTGWPNVPGILHAGATRDFQLNMQPQTVDINADNFQVPMGTLLTGTQPQGQFSLVQTTSPRFMRLASGTGAESTTDTQDMLLFSGRNTLEKAGIILVTPSRIETGQFDALVIYQAVFVGGLQLNRARSADNPIQAQFRPIATDSLGDPFGYYIRFREL